MLVLDNRFEWLVRHGTLEDQLGLYLVSWFGVVHGVIGLTTFFGNGFLCLNVISRPEYSMYHRLAPVDAMKSRLLLHKRRERGSHI